MISWDKPGTIPRESVKYPILILTIVLLSTFLSVFATIITIMAGDNIQGSLALSDPLAAWLTTLNLLGVNTTVPAASWFADRYGNKTVFCFGVLVFTLASLMAGFATNFPMIAVSRLLEGIGSGLIFPIGLATIMQTMPPKKLSLALILYVMSVFGAGFALGLPLVGYLAQFHSWRLAFFLMLPFSILSVILCALIQEETERKKTAKFDYGGFICFAAFIGLLLVALTYGPMLSTDDGWRTPYILGCFVFAFIALIATIFIERSVDNPLIPLGLFKNPVYSVTCLAMFLLGMSIFATASAMMQYMLTALSYERFVSGKLGMIYGISLAIFSVITNLIIKKIPVPIVTFMGLMILVYSYFLNNILDWQTGPDQILPILFLRGVGLGLSLGPATIEALQNVPKELSNKGATFLTFFRQVGGTYGGTLISIIVIKRKIFHVARFGEQAQTELPGYQVTFQKIFSHYKATFESSSSTAQLAQARIIQNIEIQALVQAINDAMIIFGYVTMAVALILIFLSFKYRKQLANTDYQK